MKELTIFESKIYLTALAKINDLSKIRDNINYKQTQRVIGYWKYIFNIGNYIFRYHIVYIYYIFAN